MRPVEWFTGMCALLVLPMVSEVSTILNPFVEIKTERMGQKRVTMSMETQVNQTHTHDSQKPSLAQEFSTSHIQKRWKFFQERYATKETWSNWFATFSTCNKFIDGRSYSEDVKTNRAKEIIVTDLTSSGSFNNKGHSTPVVLSEDCPILNKTQQLHYTYRVSKDVVRPP